MPCPTACSPGGLSLSWGWLLIGAVFSRASTARHIWEREMSPRAGQGTDMSPLWGHAAWRVEARALIRAVGSPRSKHGISCDTRKGIWARSLF